VKKFRLISSFFLITLILYPTLAGAMGSCDDEMSCCESTTTSDEKETDHDCMDLCLCSCCGSSVFFDVKNEVENDFSGLFSFHFVIFTYQSQFSSTFLTDIWQPPRQA